MSSASSASLPENENTLAQSGPNQDAATARTPQPVSQSPMIVVSVVGTASTSASGAAEPRVHDVNEPLLFADDLAAVRGDGIFETFMLRDSSVRNHDLHAHRFVRSADMLSLPKPDLEAWDEATELAIAEWDRAYPDLSGSDAALRWVYSRGRESTGLPSGWITVAPMAESIADARTNGIAVMSAERGFRLDLSQRSPWALIGAKTLSYAANMAALRYAHDHGFDDVIFISDDGAVLEGPTSTVVVAKGRELATPTTDAGILPGTTQASMFAIAAEEGWECVEKKMTIDDLIAADGVWLVSSVRVAARVVRLDEHEFARPDCADEVEALAARAVGE